LRKKALTLSREKRTVLASTSNKSPVTRKSQQFEDEKDLPGKENSAVMQPTDTSTAAASGAAKKRVIDEA